MVVTPSDGLAVVRGRLISGRLSWSPMRSDYLIPSAGDGGAWRIVSEDSLCRVTAIAATADLCSLRSTTCRLRALPEACDREPFLLIVCTRHIVTATP